MGWNSDRSTPDHIIDFIISEEDEIEISVSGFGIVPDPFSGPGDDRRGRGRGRGRGGRSETDSLKASLTTVDSAGLDSALEGKNLFVYNSTTGELWLNQNWALPGAGDGGVMAVLENKPAVLRASDISLIG